MLLFLALVPVADDANEDHSDVDQLTNLKQIMSCYCEKKVVQFL